jgi:hypothetical protein
MAKFPIPENCSAYVPMILKEWRHTFLRAKTNFNLLFICLGEVFVNELPIKIWMI